jgi:hypothetical protein
VVPPVGIHLGLVVINDVAVAWIGAELSNYIGRRIRTEEPLKKIMVVTMGAGAGPAIGNIGPDSIAQRVSHTAPIEPGCAEGAILDTFGSLMERYITGQ